MSQRKHPRPLFKKRIIAFPFHSKLSQHWTLGILVNLNWKPDDTLGAEAAMLPDWRLLYFDSMGANSDIMERARQFSTFLVEVSDTDVKSVCVPTLMQRSNSMDCGLYPFHFLRVFLRDRNRLIQYCTSVSTLPHVVVAVVDACRICPPLSQMGMRQGRSGSINAVWLSVRKYWKYLNVTSIAIKLLPHMLIVAIKPDCTLLPILIAIVDECIACSKLY